MAKLNIGDTVQVKYEGWKARGKVAALTEDVIYTRFEDDKEKYMTIHVTEVFEGEITSDTWQTCPIGSIQIHYEAPDGDPLSEVNYKNDTVQL